MTKLLSECKTGDNIIILKVKGRNRFRKRVIEMGFVRGHAVKVIKNAPLKDPIEYEILGYKISLRKSEASYIEVCTKEEYDKLCQKGILQNHQADFSKLSQSLKSKNKIITNEPKKKKEIDIVFIGNPNCGKTSLFNSISNSKARVGNYPGITVESLSTKHIYNQHILNLTDLPGAYSMTAYSEEELFVRRYLQEHKPDIVVNVVDTNNIERNLYLTSQLIDMDLNVVMALNMYDEFLKSESELNHKYLGELLGIPMIPTVGSRGGGISNLLNKLIEVYHSPEESLRHIHINYGIDIESSISKVQNQIQQDPAYSIALSSRYLAIKLLEADDETKQLISNYKEHDRIIELTEAEIQKIEKLNNEDFETQITNQRYGFIRGALKECFKKKEKKTSPNSNSSEKIDSILTHKYLGFPIFLSFLWLIFQATFKLGEYPAELIENSVTWISQWIGSIMSDSIIKDIITDGIIGGVGGVLVFLPNIVILFFFISIMEDSGYMARIAFIMDKLMHMIGLHGKSFVPLIMGFGCNVPAVMATRTLESKSDRIFTAMLIPFMSCSAKLPVYILITGAIFGASAPNVIFGLYLIGIAISIITAFIFNLSIFNKKETPFVMELPPYRIPTLKASLQHMWHRATQYLKKMTGIILWASLIIWALGYFPTNINYSQDFDSKIAKIEQDIESNKLDKAKGNIEIENLKILKTAEHQEHAYITKLGKFIEPTIAPLGFDWRIGVSLISGIAAKEVVVSTMGVIYQTGDSETNLSNKIKNVSYTSGIKKGERIFTIGTTWAFLFFILIYMPCISVIAVLAKETALKWSILMVIYSTTIAWIGAYIIQLVF